MDIGKLLPGHGIGNPGFWIGNVGDDPPHQEDPGGIPAPIGMAD